MALVKYLSHFYMCRQEIFVGKEKKRNFGNLASLFPHWQDKNLIKYTQDKNLIIFTNINEPIIMNCRYSDDKDAYQVNDRILQSIES
jgi:hypothetical protein